VTGEATSSPSASALRWSRQLLRAPLLCLAVAFGIAAVGGAFAIAERIDLHDKHFPGSLAGLVYTTLAVTANIVIAAALIWAARIVGRPD